MKNFILTLVGAQPHQVKNIIAMFKGFAVLWFTVLVLLLLSAALMLAAAYFGWLK